MVQATFEENKSPGPFKTGAKRVLDACGAPEEDALLVEVGAGVEAGVGVPPEVEDDGFSVDIQTMLGKIGSVTESQRHRRLCGKHALQEEMEEIPRDAP